MNSDVGVLLSIHMTSNRPEAFVQFLDRLDDTTDDHRSVEVVTKVDSDDPRMNELVACEQQRRRFKITHLSTPLDGGFFGVMEMVRSPSGK